MDTTSSAGSVEAARLGNRRASGGSTPTSALHDLNVEVIPHDVAKHIVVRHHYLHSWPAGTFMCLGVFMEADLSGVVTIGGGPANAHRLVQGAGRFDSATLSRMYVADTLPHNTASRVLGIIVRALRRWTDLKFLITYADPSRGHLGTIYQASNWSYTGLSDATPGYDLGDGEIRHPRTLNEIYGTRSVRHLAALGLDVKLRAGVPKHRYLYFLDATWRPRLKVPVLPYPKLENHDATE